ncbi:MAG: DUF262 domain-containing protein, partial [Alphaproteobacteria bacterium]
MEKCYSLQNIKKWQFDAESKVKLPDIQRGFVWRPYQIENLWDSILRGFPTGSFLLKEN